MISECFQAGEFLSDGDCHNATKEKLRKQEKQELLSSSDSGPNNGPDDSRSTSVTSPIAMRYWNYCTNRSNVDQAGLVGSALSSQLMTTVVLQPPRGRVQWKVSSIHSDSMISRPESGRLEAGPERR